jgi:hypothetical protein
MEIQTGKCLTQRALNAGSHARFLSNQLKGGRCTAETATNRNRDSETNQYWNPKYSFFVVFFLSGADFLVLIFRPGEAIPERGWQAARYSWTEKAGTKPIYMFLVQ